MEGCNSLSPPINTLSMHLDILSVREGGLQLREASIGTLPNWNHSLISS